MLRHIFNRANAHGGQGEWNAESFGGPCRENFAVGMLHACHASGRNRHRHTDVLTDHGAGGAATFHVDGHALAQLDFLEIVFIGPVGTLGVTA